MNGPGISQSEREHRETEGAAVKAASSANGTAPPTEVTLSYGIELKIRKVPPLLVTRAQDQIEPPTIPTFYNTERQETEENPGHPDYVKAVERYNDRINVAAMNAMLLTGTSFVSAPDGLEGPDGTSWPETLEALGIEVPTSRPGRYLAWLRYYALEDALDLMQTMSAIGKATGIAEADVLTAIESFRRDEGRGPDNGGTADESAQHGDQLRAPAGPDPAGAAD